MFFKATKCLLCKSVIDKVEVSENVFDYLPGKMLTEKNEEGNTEYLVQTYKYCDNCDILIELKEINERNSV